MFSKLVALVLTISACFHGAFVQAQTGRTRVETTKTLLLSAIQNGEAHGELVGAQAEWLSKKFQSDAPIYIDIRVIKSLPGKGCKRLEVKSSQDGIIETMRDGSTRGPHKGEITYQINYCNDGLFPEDKIQVNP